MTLQFLTKSTSKFANSQSETIDKEIYLNERAGSDEELVDYIDWDAGD